jgi:predicted dinucleotide-binding enzyme
MEKIGIIGSGVVAKALAKGLIKHGYQVLAGSGNLSKQEEIKKETGALSGSFQDAVEFADTVILAVKGMASEKVVSGLSGRLKGKTIIDATNPIDDRPPVNGVISFFTSLDESLMEKLQKLAPDANFVKAFNSIGNGFMVDPGFDSKPTMFICGNNSDAKKKTAALIEKLGWEVEDMGGVESARAIEPLCILWCVPGLLHNSWSHAFKLLKK